MLLCCVFHGPRREQTEVRPWHRVPTLFSCPRVCCDWIVWLNYTSIIKIIFPPHKIIYKWWISGCCAAARCLFSRFQTSVSKFWHRCKTMLNNTGDTMHRESMNPPLLGRLLITNSLCSLVSKDLKSHRQNLAKIVKRWTSKSKLTNTIFQVSDSFYVDE